MRRETTRHRSMSTIVVTGASTGIGYATTVRLAKNATVYAGVRSESDFAALGALGGNVVPVYLDVTNADSIARAKASIGERTGGNIDAVVNNAGIVVAAPLEVVELDQFQRQFAVNVMGPLLVTQAFLPMLRASKGRIVTIGSIGGKMALPYVGPYVASKFAIEALMDALRLEMAPFGVRVILIEPGAIKTPLWGRTQAASAGSIERIAPEVLSLYAEPIRKMQALSSKIESGAIEPDRVAAVIERALASKHPHARYLVGTDARVQLAIGRLPEFIRDRLITAMLAGIK
jgi:NAD(P)-dependent dehydrogenase (short-subunit alcohol dehydrogenase family)